MGRLPARHPVACQGTMTGDSRGTWMKEEKERLSLPLFPVSLSYLYSGESFVRAKLQVDEQRLKGQLSSIDSPSPSPLKSTVYNPHRTPVHHRFSNSSAHPLPLRTPVFPGHPPSCCLPPLPSLLWALGALCSPPPCVSFQTHTLCC